MAHDYFEGKFYSRMFVIWKPRYFAGYHIEKNIVNEFF